MRCKKELYNLGITEVTTPGGNTVRAYSVERTLCDVLRPHSRVDIQIVTEAFKQQFQKQWKVLLEAFTVELKAFKVRQTLRQLRHKKELQ